MIEDKEIDRQQTIAEMYLVEGCVVVQKLCPLSELFLRSDSLTPPLLVSMVEYLKTVSKTKLYKNCTQELFDEFCQIVKKYEVNEEVYHCLISLLSVMLSREIHADIDSTNQYFFQIKKLRI
jgi:hypothetical protein